MSAVKVRDVRSDLLEDYPCAVVSAAQLYFDSDHGTVHGHNEVDIFSPLVLGNAEDLYLELLLQSPVITRVASVGSVRCILCVRTPGRGAAGARADGRWNWC
jgi:hypothetical protein